MRKFTRLGIHCYNYGLIMTYCYMAVSYNIGELPSSRIKLPKIDSEQSLNFLI